MPESILKDLLAGSAGGVAQVLVGQPFDIVKVRLQSSSTLNSPIEVAKAIVKNEGVPAFWKGSAMPIVGIGACVSLQFAGLAAAKNFFEQFNNGGSLSVGQLYLAGACGGLVNSVGSGPVELVRIRLQTQQPGSPDFYRGPWDAVKRIWTTDGVRGIYHGQVATLWREAIGYGGYFASYEWLVAERCRKTGTKRQDMPTTTAMLYAVPSGWCLWLSCYPFDVIKSRMQTDRLPSSGESRYRGFIDCAKQIWRQGGAKAFARGLSPTLMRSPFSNAATFATYEAVRNALH